MQIIETDVKGWKFEGTELILQDEVKLNEKQQVEFCKYYGIPGTLIGVDHKYSTRTSLDVAQKVIKTPVKVLIKDDGSVASVLDPKSEFCDMQKFQTLLDAASQSLGEPTIIETGSGMEATFTLPQIETDVFDGDMFKRLMKITRLNQGGVMLNAAVLRLACTNGHMMADRQFTHHYRKSMVGTTALNLAIADISMINLEEYLNSLFTTTKGAPIEASVDHFLGMKDTLKCITDKEIADFYFNDDPIVSFYEEAGIDLSTLPRSAMGNLKSGLSYYDCFNILTHAAKQNGKKSLSDEIEIGRWIKPSYIGRCKRIIHSYSGSPHFSQEIVTRLRGDVV